MKKKMAVTVTKEDIEQSMLLEKMQEGHGWSAGRLETCPIACALNRVLPPGRFAVVGPYFVNIDDGNGCRWKLSRRATAFIRRHDKTRKGRGLSFTMELSG